MTGLWEETLERCKRKLALAKALHENGDVVRAMRLNTEAREEARVVTTWARMTRMLLQEKRIAKDVR